MKHPLQYLVHGVGLPDPPSAASTGRCDEATNSWDLTRVSNNTAALPTQGLTRCQSHAEPPVLGPQNTPLVIHTPRPQHNTRPPRPPPVLPHSGESP